jgi:putative DNA primase/helicase
VTTIENMSVQSSQEVRRKTKPVNSSPPPPQGQPQSASPPEIDFPPISKRPCFKLYKTFFLSNNKPYDPGVYWHTVEEEKNSSGNKVEVLIDLWICSVLIVVAITRTGSGKEHSYLIEYIPHGETTSRYEVLSQAALLGRPEDALKALRDIGISVLHKNAKLVRDYLDSQHLRFNEAHPENFWESVKCVGWHGEKTFVLPHTIIGEHSKVCFAGKGDVAEYGEKGTLVAWQNNVAYPCRDNPYLVAGLALSLSGPLLELLNIPGIAVHFYGDSTAGKTTSQFLAVSSWGSPKFLLTWSGTVNGLESQAASRSSTLTALDESQLIDPKQLDNGIYLLLGGISKTRMNRDASAKAIVRWSPAIFSSGEHSTQTHLTTKTTDHKAGQAVRMIDVPVVAAHGLFDDLHDWQTSKEFAEYLKNAAAQDYGFAGPKFVEHLIKNRASMSLRARLATASGNINNGAILSAQEERVLRSFALIALAGELAIESGILPWKAGSAQTAVKKLFETWRTAQPQSNTSREHAQILKKIADFIDAHLDSRFSNINWTPSPNRYGTIDEEPGVYNRAGYWEEVANTKMVLFTSGGLREATQGFDFNRALRALGEAEAFYDTGSNGEKAKRVRTPDGRNLKLYHINPEKLT